MTDDRNMSVKAFLTVGDGKQEVRRFGIPEAVSTNFNYVKERIRTVFGLGSKNFTVTWQDSEGDQIVISSDDELLEAISDILCRKGDILLRLYVTVEESRNDTNDPSKVVHVGVVCDGCDGPVIGNRYKCTRCKDYDLCEECEKKGVHPRHKKIKLTTSKNPFSVVFGEFVKEQQSDERAKAGFEKDFSEKCDVNDEFADFSKRSSGKLRASGGRRWYRGGHWTNASDRNGDFGSEHLSNAQCGFSGTSSSTFCQGFQEPHHHGQQHQGPHHHGQQHQGPHHHGQQHQGPHQHHGPHNPHQPNQSFPHCGAFLGGWPFVSVGVGVPPNGEHMVPPDAQRVAEEASKFASQMASQHVADLFKGIWTAWSGHPGNVNHHDTNDESNKAPKAPRQEDNATTQSQASESAPMSSSQPSGQFASADSNKGTDRVINIEMEQEIEVEKESSVMEQETVRSHENECTPMDMGNNFNEDDASQTSVTSGGSLKGEEWTLLNQEVAKENVVNTVEEVDNDIIEIPVEVVNNGSHIYPSMPVSNETITDLTPEEQRIRNALDHMKAMGYSDEGGWLTRLLLMKNGDINQVLDLLLVRNKNKN